MRPVRGAGKCGEGRGFKTPIRRRVKLRYIRDALRGRASLMPLRCPSSSPQNPLRWAFVGAPIGCVEKRKRFLMVLREKGSGGGIPDFVRNARGACYGGLARWKLSGFAHSTKYGSCESWGPSRILCRSLLLPHSGIPRDPGTVISILSQQQKEERCIRKRPFHQSSATANVRQQKRKPGHPSISPASETAICS